MTQTGRIIIRFVGWGRQSLTLWGPHLILFVFTIQVIVLLETAKLQVVSGSCAVGNPGWSPRNFGCNDALETDKVVILGGPTSTLADAALGSSILVASFKVKSLVDTGVALIEGTIDEIIDKDASSGTSEQILGVAISVGKGFMKLSGSRRRLLQAEDVYGNVTDGSLLWEETPTHMSAGHHRHLLQTTAGACNLGTEADGRVKVLGDVTGNSLFNGADLIFLDQMLLAKECTISGTGCSAGAETNLPFLSAMGMFQRQQVDTMLFYLRPKNEADALCSSNALTDATDSSPCATNKAKAAMIELLLETVYFMDVDHTTLSSVVTVPSTVTGQLTIAVKFRDLASCVVSDPTKAEVLVELRGSKANTGMSAITGEVIQDTTSVDGSAIFRAAVVNNLWTVTVSPGSGGWQTSSDSGIFILSRKSTAAGGFSASIRAFYDSTTDYMATALTNNIAWDPLVSSIVFPTSSATTTSPTSAPTASPTTASPTTTYSPTASPPMFVAVWTAAYR